MKVEVSQESPETKTKTHIEGIVCTIMREVLFWRALLLFIILFAAFYYLLTNFYYFSHFSRFSFSHFHSSLFISFVFVKIFAEFEASRRFEVVRGGSRKCEKV